MLRFGGWCFDGAVGEPAWRVLAWLCLSALVTAGCALKAALEPKGSPARFAPLRRYTLLLGACSLATLLNPYGYRLHQHMVNYLSSVWIRQVVEEFQSPDFAPRACCNSNPAPRRYRHDSVVIAQGSLAGDATAVVLAHSALISAATFRFMQLWRPRSAFARPVCSGGTGAPASSGAFWPARFATVLKIFPAARGAPASGWGWPWCC